MVRIKCQRSTQIHRNVENIDIMYNCAVQSIVLRQLPIDVNRRGVVKTNAMDNRSNIDVTAEAVDMNIT